jgi:RND family efflux transporter MFP subunit
MDDKKELLGALKINDTQRNAPSNGPRWIVTGLGAVVLAAIAWFWLLPGADPVSVTVARAIKAGGDAPVTSTAVLDATGYVTARRKATVSSKLTGKVREVFIEEGMVVEAGQLLATLDDSSQRANFNLVQAQLESAKAKLKEVDIRRQEAKLTLDRTVELAQKKLASTADLDRDRLAVEGFVARLEGLEKEIEVASGAVKVQQQQLDDMQIRAPFSGVVIAKAAQPGEMISPVSAGGGFTRTGICTIVDMESLEIEVDVNEAYINRVTAGQPVEAMLNSYPDWRIPAEVITIIPTADRSKATVRVRIGFKERDSKILPDMGVRVAFLEEQITTPETRQMSGVMIPQSAVATTQEGNVVYVVADNTVSVLAVKLGPKQGNLRNITSGLRPGDNVIVSLDDKLIEQLEDGSVVVTNT